MRLFVFLVIVGGCSEGALPLAEGTCRYSFAAPETRSGDSTHCALTRGSGGVVLHFEDLLAVSVNDSADAGRARLESSTSPRASLALPGERFGLTLLEYSGQQCDDWAGHVFWDISPDRWHVEMVGTSQCPAMTFGASFDSP